MPRWSLPLLSAVTALLLAAGALGVVAVDGDGGTGSVAGPRSGSSPATTSVPAASSTDNPASSNTTTSSPTTAGEVGAVVPSLQAFVEKERGLAFSQPVKVTLLADKPFEKRLGQSDEEDLADVRDAEAVLQAMGLLERGVDLAAVVESFSAGAVLGFYDPETDELVVRGAEASPFVRIVLVHELVHALEDQRFDLDRNELGDEAFIGFQALAEGSAIRIEDRYRATMSRSERRSVDRDERAQSAKVPDDVPRVVQVLFGFPYAFGPALVRALVRAGGQARLDAAFGDPPDSSEHVLDPRRYLRGDPPRDVPVPPADGDPFDDGEIGQLFLSLMLRAELDDDDADDAAEGWGGDHYVAWRDGGRTCVRMAFVMDTAKDTDELAAALAEWADDRSGTASASGTSLRTCG